jgi:hypothetical protein
MLLSGYPQRMCVRESGVGSRESGERLHVTSEPSRTIARFLAWFWVGARISVPQHVLASLVAGEGGGAQDARLGA